MLTKGKLLELLKCMDLDPAFLTMIIKECFEQLPDVVSWKLSRQLYVKYFWQGEVLTLKNNLTGEEQLFTSNSEVYQYLTGLGYKTSMQGIRDAFSFRRSNYCNHEFFKPIKETKKEITYFE